MDWKKKSRLFRVLAVIPFGTHIHFQMQKYLTREWPRKTSVLEQLLIAARRVYETTEGHRGRMLEIGAGRDLAVAVALRLMGVGHVTCVDVSRLAHIELVNFSAAYMANRLGVPAPIFKSWGDVDRFGISYRAPALLQGAGLEPSSFDCFFSIDTLEHIPLQDLRQVLLAAKGLVSDEGIFVHLIDYGDHYARSDNGLSRFNFLTYSERDWLPFNSKLQYVNRVRHSQFLRLFEDIGMKRVRIEADVEPAEQYILENLDQQFKDFQIQDLFTIRAMIVAAKEIDHE